MYEVELWAKLQGDLVSFAVRGPADRWVALLFKDFPHHGMIGDFNDVKLLSAKGVEDFFLADRPNATGPGPRKKAGVHT
ncbi:MAG: hypothetical protein HYV08_12405 [Deltaproteobacteria bacterium]|nr:hypothetical protein [Deltaproteobacteria bacterium]MBI3076207.1 hypothetical protein [Deltaproteobacteria bacterium]